MRARQQHSIHEGLEPVMLHDRSALHLAHEARSKNPFDGTPGVIGPNTEKESRPGPDSRQHLCQTWDTFACTAKGVDVYLECDGGQKRS